MPATCEDQGLCNTEPQGGCRSVAGCKSHPHASYKGNVVSDSDVRNKEGAKKRGNKKQRRGTLYQGLRWEEGVQQTFCPQGMLGQISIPSFRVTGLLRLSTKDGASYLHFNFIHSLKS